MSMFGDSGRGCNKNDLYDNIKYFFENGGTLQELFEVLAILCEYKSEAIKVGE